MIHRRNIQGSETQRNVRSSMSDPDMFLNYMPTFDSGKQAQQFGGTARLAFPEGVHVPEGNAAFLPYLHMCCKHSMPGQTATAQHDTSYTLSQQQRSYRQCSL